MQNKSIPQRTCVSCRQIKDKRELIRIVRTPEGEFKVDLNGKQNGRGAYICNSRECFDKLQKNHGLDRAFKMTVPKEFYDSSIKELFGE